MTYKKEIVAAFLRAFGIPAPEFEHLFARSIGRKWRFDLAWPAHQLAVEAQGGLFTGGRHTQGAALLKEHEKLNAAAIMGWRILYCQPRDLTRSEFARTIIQALEGRYPSDR